MTGRALYVEQNSDPVLGAPNDGLNGAAQNQLLTALLLGGRIVGVERALPSGKAYEQNERAMTLTVQRDDGRRLRVDLAGWGYDASGLDVDVFETEPAKPTLDELRARMPLCPCGKRALTMSVGVVLVKRRLGERSETSGPMPGAPERYECPDGHWFTVDDDGHHRLCGPPEEVTVLHEPRGR